MLTSTIDQNMQSERPEQPYVFDRKRRTLREVVRPDPAAPHTNRRADTDSRRESRWIPPIGPGDTLVIHALARGPPFRGVADVFAKEDPEASLVPHLHLRGRVLRRACPADTETNPDEIQEVSHRSCSPTTRS